MILCLNPVTAKGAKSFEEFVEVASKIRYEGIDYGINPIAEKIQNTSAAAVVEWLASKNILIGNVGLPVQFREDEEKFRDDLKKLPTLAEAAEAVGCTRCCTWLPPSINEPVLDYTCTVARRLRECAKVLAEHGISLGIEWVGPKTLRTKRFEWVYTLPGAMKLIEAIGMPNVGLLVDSFHWYTAGHSASDIENLPLSKIVHVHINDAPDRPVDEQIDNQRLLPGEGIIDLKTFLGTLIKKGYKGTIGIEVFSDELPKLGLEGAARKAKEAYDKVISSL